MSTPEQRAHWRSLVDAVGYKTENFNPVAHGHFVVAARTAVPALLDDVARLEAENAELRAALAKIHRGDDLPHVIAREALNL